MRFKFSPKSKLHGREVKTTIDRFVFVPHSNEGETEYILCYKGRIPTPEEEPNLFAGAQVTLETPDEATLRYPGLTEIVMLLTIEADDRFRREHPDLVAQNELFTLGYQQTTLKRLRIDDGNIYIKSEGSKDIVGPKESTWGGKVLVEMLENVGREYTLKELMAVMGQSKHRRGSHIATKASQVLGVLNQLRFCFKYSPAPYAIVSHGTGDSITYSLIEIKK